MSWQGTMTCQLMNSLGSDIGNLYFAHSWSSYLDSPPWPNASEPPVLGGPSPVIPAGGVLDFTINVGGSASISEDGWQFCFFAEGTWWSCGFDGVGAGVDYKVCDVTDDDYESGNPVIINFMSQGWSVDLPVSKNCANNSYDSNTNPPFGPYYYYEAALPSQAAVAAWATSLYQDILSRAPASTEVSVFVAGYQTAAMSGSTGLSAYRDARVAAMFKGGEYCKNQILALYQNLLGRTPDDNELARQMFRLDTGTALQSFMATFCSSEEFIKDHPLPTAYTNAVYQALLNRAPTDSELSTVTSELQSGTRTPAQFCTGIIQSPEFCTDLLTEIYQTFLKRAPTTTEIAENAPLLITLSLQQVSTDLANSAEYLQNCAASAG